MRVAGVVRNARKGVRRKGEVGSSTAREPEQTADARAEGVALAVGVGGGGAVGLERLSRMGNGLVSGHDEAGEAVLGDEALGVEGHVEDDDAGLGLADTWRCAADQSSPSCCTHPAPRLRCLPPLQV